MITIVRLEEKERELLKQEDLAYLAVASSVGINGAHVEYARVCAELRGVRLALTYLREAESIGSRVTQKLENRIQDLEGFIIENHGEETLNAI